MRLPAGLVAWLRAPTFSPRGFVVRAAAVALVHGILTAAGLRAAMSVLALTTPEGMSPAWAGFACVVYLISYLAFTLVVPSVLIGAALWAIAERVFRKSA
jgi:hypothetical protein